MKLVFHVCGSEESTEPICQDVEVDLNPKMVYLKRVDATAVWDDSPELVIGSLPILPTAGQVRNLSAKEAVELTKELNQKEGRR